MILVRIEGGLAFGPLYNSIDWGWLFAFLDCYDRGGYSFRWILNKRKEICTTTPTRPIRCHSSKQAFGCLRLSPRPFWRLTTLEDVNKTRVPCGFCQHPGGEAERQINSVLRKHAPARSGREQLAFVKCRFHQSPWVS